MRKEKKFNFHETKEIEIVFNNGVRIVLINVYLIRLIDKTSKFFNRVNDNTAKQYFVLFWYQPSTFKVYTHVYNYDDIKHFRVLKSNFYFNKAV